MKPKEIAKSCVRVLTDRYYRFAVLSYLEVYRNMDDETNLKKMYKLYTGKELDLDNPVTFCEKLQWLKLYDRRPEYNNMVDKYEAKKFATRIIGKEHVIPVYGVWDSFDEIDFDSLPERFVLKANHGSGWNIIVTDKSTFDREAAKAKFDIWMKLLFCRRHLPLDQMQ